MDNEQKIWVGKVTTLIILFLVTFSLFYKVLGLNFKTVNSILELIDDASIFMTFVCVSFFVIAFKRESKSYPLMATSLVDIIIVNRLYSNSQLLSIIVSVKKLDVRIILCLIIAIFFVLILIKSYKKKAEDTQIGTKKKSGKTSFIHNNSKEASYEKNIKQKTDENDLEQKINANNLKQNTDKKTKEASSPENDKTITNNNIILRIFNIIVTFILLTVIIWSILDYVCYNIISLKRPEVLTLFLKPNILYNIAIFCCAVFIVFVGINLFLLRRNKILESIKGIGSGITTFRFSAISAIVIEVCLFIFGSEIKAINITNNFLSSISDNGFSFIAALIIIFLILQIACTILFNLFSRNGNNSDILRNIEERTTQIEKKMINLAYGIIESCIDLFGFIPDFFKTIGVLLLDKTIDTNDCSKQNETKAKKETNSQNNKGK